MFQFDLFGSRRVLVCCEFTGTVRDAFLKRGFDAWSCDIRPDEKRSNRHITGDARSIIGDGWHLIIIAHPPCTRLCNSGVRWLHTPPPGRTIDEMWLELDEGAALFSDLWNAPAPHVAAENPIMHRYARERIVNYEPAAQIIQPHWFGDPQFKATGLHLRKLPPLVPTRKLVVPAKGTAEHKAWSRVHRMPPGKNRGRERSRFFPGAAAAMAKQWGDYIALGAEALAA